jgi:hypothetical protein
LGERGASDQLPANYVEKINIRQYIYCVYSREEELIDLVTSARNESLTEDQFYARITPDPFQQLESTSTPKDK